MARLPIGIVAFGAAFGGLAFLIDSGVAGKTLFEAEVPGSGTAVPSVLEWKIPVEHPGAGHERTWDGYDVEFTPPVDGELRLTVTLLTPHVPTVHVRMGDEEKTDGQRIPSY